MASSLVTEPRPHLMRPWLRIVSWWRGILNGTSPHSRGEQQRREAEFRRIADCLPALVAYFDLEGRYAHINARYREWLRLEPGQMIGRTAREVLSETVGEAYWEKAAPDLQRALLGETVRVENFGVFPDGRARYVEITYAPDRDAQGTVLGVVSLVTDISDRKYADESLLRGEERFRAFVDASFDVVYSMSADWFEMRQLEGRGFIRDAEKPIDDWLEKYIDPEDQPHVMEAIQQAIRDKSVFELEHRVRRVDGTLGWTLSRAVPILDVDGNIREWFGMAKDVTARHEAEKILREATTALRQSEAQFRQLAEMIPNLAWTANSKGWIYWYNQRWYQYTGTTPEQMEGWGWQSVHDPAVLPAVLERWRVSIQTGKPFEMVFPLRGADGIFRPFLTRVAPLSDEHGKVMQWFGTNTEITELTEAQRREREARAEVERLNAKLEARVGQRTHELEIANRELEAFSYSVSHDLRAPLRSLDGFSQILLEDYSQVLGTEGRDYLQRIRNASQRMARLIDDLLQLSRVNRSELRTALVDLSTLAATILEELRAAHPERQVETQVQPGLATSGDPRLLEVALRNLLDNAWKFTSRQEHGIIEVGSEEHDGRQVFFVRDNGAGFQMQYAGQLFQPFQRLHAIGTFEGTGVGLATVRRIIERHRGRVWAEAAPGRGATFYFEVAA